MNPREEILTSALKIVTEDRNLTYGDPEDNFRNIAEFWTQYLLQKYNIVNILQSEDVALMMILMKVARLGYFSGYRDPWEDIAGYAACGFDCTVEKEK
jgi:CO dehydrogenase/acetyl-CoA synthase gamma subunit (corrinoid Fe-S protein)